MARQNGITIKEALKMDCMKKSKIITGHKGINNIISNVNIMADPDIMSWVGEGEFLLTTGYSLNKVSIGEQKKLIREAKKQKLVGLGVKIKPYLEAIPKEIVDLAEDIDFTIIDINENISLSEIMTPIVNEIFNRKSYLLSKIEKIYEQFMGAMLNRMNIDDIAKLTSKNIRNPVLLKLYFPTENIEVFDQISKNLKTDIRKNFENFYKNAEKRKAKKMDESIEIINKKYVDRIVIPIVAKDSIFGHISAWGIEGSIGGYEVSVLEIASTTLALEILKAISVREVENRYKSEFIEDLISMDKTRKEKAIDRLSFFNLNRKDNYLAITIKVKEKVVMDMTSIQQYISKLNDEIEDSISKLKLRGIVGTKIEKIIILISNESNNYKNKINEFIDSLEKIALKEDNVEIKIGVGRFYKDIDFFYNSYIDSLKAISTGKILNNKVTTKFNDLGIYKILCQDKLKEELNKFYDTTIKVLVDYDVKKDTELVRTLDSYFNNNGNLRKMSTDLFTHYNTVLYRVQRIKEITGMDLDNPKDRLSLEVSLKIKKLLKKNDNID